MNRIAVIDIGSNSIKLYVAEKTPAGIRTLADDNVVTRMGQGLFETGMLSREVMDRNLAGLKSLYEKALVYEPDEVKCVGTMALRSAGNSGDFGDMLKSSLGLDLEIIPGEEEARLSYRAALMILPGDYEGAITVFDTGGGSTEFIHGTRNEIWSRVSVNIGAVAPTELFFSDDPVRAGAVLEAERYLLSEIEKARVGNPGGKLIGIGGGVTAMGSVYLGLETYDRDRVSGLTLHRDEVLRQKKLYESKKIEERRLIPGLPSKRADIILTAACIVDVIMTKFHAERLTISDRGLRHALAEEILYTRACRVM